MATRTVALVAADLTVDETTGAVRVAATERSAQPVAVHFVRAADLTLDTGTGAVLAAFV